MYDIDRVADNNSLWSFAIVNVSQVSVLQSDSDDRVAHQINILNNCTNWDGDSPCHFEESSVLVTFCNEKRERNLS